MPQSTYLSHFPLLLESSDVLAVFGVQQAEQCSITQPLNWAGRGGRDGVSILVPAIAAGVNRELDGRRHLPQRERDKGLGVVPGRPPPNMWVLGGRRGALSSGVVRELQVSRENLHRVFIERGGGGGGGPGSPPPHPPPNPDHHQPLLQHPKNQAISSATTLRG